MTKLETADILIVDQTNINADLISDIFSKNQIPVNFDLSQSISDLLSKLEEKNWQAIFLIIDGIPISIDALIDAMPNINKKCPIIIISQDYDRDTALNHIQAGATDAFSLDEIDHLAELTKKLLLQNQTNSTIQKQRSALKESHERFIALSKQVPMAIAFIHEGAFININPAFQHFFSVGSSEEVSEISFLDLIVDEDISKVKDALKEISKNNIKEKTVVESVNVKKSAELICPVNLLISQTNINGESGLQVIFQPTQWNIKPSTAIANYSQLISPESFTQSLNQIIRKTNRKHAYSLSFFELDGYSRIKTNIGITRSDHLLHEISAFMATQASEAMKISRLNSDVYTLLVSAETTAECIDAINALQAAFNTHSFNSIEHNISVSSNIGVVHITNQLHTLDQALSLADVACTVSRNRKQNKPHIYNSEEDRSTVERVDQNWVDKIKDALRFDNFKLLFQPIVSLGSEHENLYEVLLRIKRSGGEDGLPSQFLHFARQSKLESDIDKWVVKNAVNILEENNKEPIRLFINLSESSLKSIGFIEWLEEHYSSQIINLVFEIPEDIAIKWQSETLHFIQQIRSHDGTICIDQYGNHPDDTSQINALRADFHKVDGAFINNLSTNRKHQSIIHNICLDTEESDTKLIANYVQDSDSLAILWREGFDFIQGNYLQAPAAHLDYKFEDQI